MIYSTLAFTANYRFITCGKCVHKTTAVRWRVQDYCPVCSTTYRFATRNESLSNDPPNRRV